MKTLCFASMLLFLLADSFAPAHADTVPAAADQKVTFLVIYRAGPAWPKGARIVDLPLKDHGRYMLSLYKQGVMKMAGPLTDDAGGAVVLEVSGEEQAKDVAEKDPAVVSGIFVYELHPWAPVPWERFLEKPAS